MHKLKLSHFKGHFMQPQRSLYQRMWSLS